MNASEYYQPFPRQQTFHDSRAKYRLFGGAAGPGKTKALLWEAIFQASLCPGSDSLLLRRSYPELESSLLAYFRRDIPRKLYKSYNEAKHVVTWNNGSTTRFGYCRNENDVYQYQGAEFLFIGLDELTHFTLKQWQFLTSRNRCPIRGSFACMAGATNPGNIGHAWVKALWVDRVPPPAFERPDLYDPRDYDFIRARLDDNPIYANDAEYRRTLEVLPEHLRRAFLEGDWNVFAGQYFDIFDFGRHTARPDEIRLEPWWPRWISIDWGFHHPSAVYWHCAVPVTTGPFGRHPEHARFGGRSEGSLFDRTSERSFDPAKGAFPQDDNGRAFGPRVFTYREFVQPGLSPRMLAQAIVERTGREHITEVFLSPDAFAHRTAEASIAEQLADVLIANGLPRPCAADDDRIGGWQLMYQLLESDAWLITDNCAKLIECIPQLVRDDRRPEDIRKVDGDDPADAARYGLVSGARLAGLNTGGWFGGAGFDAMRDSSMSHARSFVAQHPAPARSTTDPNVGPGLPAQAGFSPSPFGAEHDASPDRARHAVPLQGAHGAGEHVGARYIVPAHEERAAYGRSGAHFVHGMPLGEQIARQVSAEDPTSRAIHYQRLESEARRFFRPKPLPRRRG